jgi:hypothetical protein
VKGGLKAPFLLTACIQMRAMRDFYNERASALAALAEQSNCQDQQSDLLDLARAWRDLAGVWKVSSGNLPKNGSKRNVVSGDRCGRRDCDGHCISSNLVSNAITFIGSPSKTAPYANCKGAGARGRPRGFDEYRGALAPPSRAVLA